MVAPGGPPKFPISVTDVSGQVIDVVGIAGRQRFVVITLKATWCEVCQEQLVRIREQLGKVRFCPVTFLVLSPGPADAIRGIRDRTQTIVCLCVDIDMDSRIRYRD